MAWSPEATSSYSVTPGAAPTSSPSSSAVSAALSRDASPLWTDAGFGAKLSWGSETLLGVQSTCSRGRCRQKDRGMCRPSQPVAGYPHHNLNRLRNRCLKVHAGSPLGDSAKARPEFHVRDLAAPAAGEKVKIISTAPCSSLGSWVQPSRGPPPCGSTCRVVLRKGS
jgi:hypothetical protein